MQIVAKFWKTFCTDLPGLEKNFEKVVLFSQSGLNEQMRYCWNSRNSWGSKGSKIFGYGKNYWCFMQQVLCVRNSKFGDYQSQAKRIDSTFAIHDLRCLESVDDSNLSATNLVGLQYWVLFADKSTSELNLRARAAQCHYSHER